jgi:hypothetical protein
MKVVIRAAFFPKAFRVAHPFLDFAFSQRRA